MRQHQKLRRGRAANLNNKDDSRKSMLWLEWCYDYEASQQHGVYRDAILKWASYASSGASSSRNCEFDRRVFICHRCDCYDINADGIVLAAIHCYGSTRAENWEHKGTRNSKNTHRIGITYTDLGMTWKIRNLEQWVKTTESRMQCQNNLSDVSQKPTMHCQFWSDPEHDGQKN